MRYNICFLFILIFSISSYGQNVGIGTTTPGYLFTVKGTGNEVYTVMSEDGTTSTDNLSLQIAPGNGSSSTRIRYLVGSFGHPNLGFMIGNYRPAPLRFVTSNSEHMRIDANRLVGINTNSPSSTLDVNGIVRCLSVTQTSDVRYKENITPLTQSLEKIKQMSAVTWNWKIKDFPGKNFSSERQIGFVAQEIEKVVPEVVFTDKEGYKSIDYSKITALLTDGMQKQQELIEKQGEEIQQLRKQIQLLSERLK